MVRSLQILALPLFLSRGFSTDNALSKFFANALSVCAFYNRVTLGYDAIDSLRHVLCFWLNSTLVVCWKLSLSNISMMTFCFLWYWLASTGICNNCHPFHKNGVANRIALSNICAMWSGDESARGGGGYGRWHGESKCPLEFTVRLSSVRAGSGKEHCAVHPFDLKSVRLSFLSTWMHGSVQRGRKDALTLLGLWVSHCQQFFEKDGVIIRNTLLISMPGRLIANVCLLIIQIAAVQRHLLKNRYPLTGWWFRAVWPHVWFQLCWMPPRFFAWHSPWAKWAQKKANV